MPLSAFSRRSSWFGDEDEADGPTPLFPPGVIATNRSSMFPTAGDTSPVLGSLRAGWKGLGDWLNGPAASDAGGEDGLLAYKPTSRIQAIGDALGGAAKGVLNARGPGANWLGSGLLGAGEGMAHTREHDLELRKLANETQYKNAELALKRLEATRKDTKDRYLTGKSGDVIYDTQAPGGTPTIMAQIPDTTVVNGQLIDKNTGKPIGAAVPTQPTTFEGAAVNALAPGGVLPAGAAQKEFNADIYQQTKPTATQVSVSPSYIQGQGETRESQTIGEQQGKAFGAAADRLSSYQARRGELETMKNIVEHAPQGPLEGYKDYWRAGAAMLTGKPDADLDARTVFTGMANKLVKDDLGSLGTAVSDGDVRFASKMAANPNNTKGANQVMLEMRAKALDRQNAVDNFQVEWRSRHGNMLAKDEKGRDFWRAAQEEFGKTPLYDKDFQAWADGKLGRDEPGTPAGDFDYRAHGF